MIGMQSCISAEQALAMARAVEKSGGEPFSVTQADGEWLVWFRFDDPNRAEAISGHFLRLLKEQKEFQRRQNSSDSKTLTPKAPARDLNSILKRLIKLKPTKRASAVNSIKAIFQLTAPITDEAANKIVEDLRKRGSLTIDANDKLQIRNA